MLQASKYITHSSFPRTAKQTHTSSSEIMALFYVVVAACLVTAWAQQQQYTTPVPILKQINRQNEDGSYSYGYEAADGTFKIETKYPSGEVYGKYGYVDENGKVRTVEYGASKKGGFNPSGTDINVPPPTLVQSTNNLADNDYDDGSYREDPSVYYKNVPASQQSKIKSRFNSAPAARQQPAVQQQQYSSETSGQSLSWSAPVQSRNTWSAPPAPAPQQQWNQQPTNYNLYNGHPAVNIDPITGSYTLNYVG